MNKNIHTYKAEGEYQILPVVKWLRQHGEMNLDFTIHHMNYSKLHVEFHNEKLELMYIFEHVWAKSNTK